MPRFLLPLICTFAALPPHPAHADRTYKVYKSNSFGQKSLFAEPEAIIEVDDFTGEAKVYEPNLFGEADTFKGPKYIIESDSLFSTPRTHHHSPLPELGDDSHEHHGIRSHDDDEECEEE